MRNGMSLSMIGANGCIPKSWWYSEVDTKLAKDALYFCRDRLYNWRVEQKNLKVYYRDATSGTLGRCFYNTGIIVLRKDAGLHTLAHEIAHFGYHEHGPLHTKLTEKIYNYLQKGESKWNGISFIQVE